MSNIESMILLKDEYLKKAKEIKDINPEEYKQLMNKYHNTANKISYLNNIEARRERNKEYMKSYYSNDINRAKHYEYTLKNSQKNYIEYKKLKELFKIQQTNPEINNILIF